FLAQTWIKQHWMQFLVYTAILVITDSILDPGAVARGLWKYSDGGIWFNVPLQNFMGWIISGTLVYFILKLILKPISASSSEAISKHLWIGAISLLVSIFLWTGVNAGYQLWLPAIIGFIFGSIILVGICKRNAETS
ncbi:MAG: carotenoid biosynthesis protein, partial [Kordia sp.]|uniref:carotenoid biosynthesis protein n=1 Tax=Kordia sp. TaxID=1965332 RepID=UPI00385ACE16